jgi:glycosyltransferase involved in cell wall biosynthesis
MTRISIIGKLYGPGKSTPADGGRLKVFIYRKKLIDEGFEANVIDLFNWKKHPFYLIFSIKKAIRRKDIILIMGGPSGCRLLIPLVNKLNHKIKTRVVFCPLGIGTFDKILKNLDQEHLHSFLVDHNYGSISDSHMSKELKKLDLIMPQNEIIADAYKSFYGLKNVSIVYNFRETNNNQEKHVFSKQTFEDPIPLLYLSRVTDNKGIFDLIKAINIINNNPNKPFFTLSIYGEKQLSKEKEMEFSKSINGGLIKYYGIASQDEISNIFSKNAALVMPTHYYGEGTPGVLIESLLAATPVIVSSYCQASLLINEGFDGLIFKIGSVNSLVETLKKFHSETDKLTEMEKNALLASAQYTYSYNRERFLKAILGDEFK